MIEYISVSCITRNANFLIGYLISLLDLEKKKSSLGVTLLYTCIGVGLELFGESPSIDN